MPRFFDLLNELNSMPIQNNEKYKQNEDTESENHSDLSDSSEISTRLKDKKRYLQIAFNYDLNESISILNRIPQSDKIIVEVGTPLIKKEGMYAIQRVSNSWNGYIIADMKISDGAESEVDMAADAGASAVTALGNAPVETLDLFIKRCKEREIDSMIDLIGVQEPLKKLIKLKYPPRVLILHRGRDEESNRTKTIPYKEINKLKGRFESLISAAGGVDLREARSAIFNGADIVVVNVASAEDKWAGIDKNANIPEIAHEFLKAVD